MSVLIIQTLKYLSNIKAYASFTYSTQYVKDAYSTQLSTQLLGVAAQLSEQPEGMLVKL